MTSLFFSIPLLLLVLSSWMLLVCSLALLFSADLFSPLPFVFLVLMILGVLLFVLLFLFFWFSLSSLSFLSGSLFSLSIFSLLSVLVVAEVVVGYYLSSLQLISCCLVRKLLNKWQPCFALLRLVFFPQKWDSNPWFVDLCIVLVNWKQENRGEGHDVR